MKRSEKFTFVNHAKKAKLQEQDDDVWGEDPEIDAFDKCLDLASQLCSQDLPANNLTSYDAFKPKTDVYTSTQAFLQPSTSYFKLPKENILNSSTVSTIIKKDVTSHELQQDLMYKIQQLEQQNKKLKDGYESKDGEISILRSSLKTAQKAVDIEKMQKLKCVEENQQKWNIKFNSATRDLSQIKCELNLKDLEITNLRDKLAQSKKIVNSSLNMSMFTEEMNLSQVNFKRPAVPNRSVGKCTKQIQTSQENEIKPRESGIYYPLHNLISNAIFEKCLQENSTIQLKSIAESSCSAYRHNFSMTQCDSVIFLNPVSTENIAIASVTSLYPEISQLMKFTEDEINSDIATKSVGKIVCLSRELLLCLLNKLQKIEEDVSFDDIEDMNHLYLEQTQSVYPSDCIFGGTPWCENEAAIDLRRCLSIVATLTLNCNIVTKYLTDDLYNEFNLNEFAILLKTDQLVKYEFLNILLQITTVIEKIRRGHQFSGLLASIIKLLNNLAHKPLPLESYYYIVNIFRQIIFTRPSKPVFKYICEFLRTISIHYKFVTQLCALSNTELVQKKDGIIYFTNDICTFRILATELQECNIDIEMACNIIQFLNNTITCNVPWMYHQDGPRCECLVQVYSLAVEILYNSLEEFTSRNLQIIDKTILQTYYTMFRVGLIVLNILTVRIPDLVIRCSRLYSQYQTIIKNISVIKDDLNFETAHGKYLSERLFKSNRNILETVLENLICQLNSEELKMDSLNTSVVTLFNNSFTTF